VVLANAEGGESDLLGEFDFFEQVLYAPTAPRFEVETKLSTPICIRRRAHSRRRRLFHFCRPFAVAD